MTCLLCVDPGLHVAGVALFRDRRLVEAKCLRISDTTSRSAAGAAMAREIMSWCKGRRGVPHELVLEWPQVYTRDKSKGNPNDLLPLAGLCAAVAAVFADAVATSYIPREWKHTVDGDVMVERIEERLRETGELDSVLEKTKTYRHNAVDACGIGLHHLGRLERRRVFPR